MSDAAPTPADPGVVWVSSEVTPDGRHVLAVEFDADTSRPLGRRAEATAYAETVLTAAAYAEYDAAVMHQLTHKVGIPATDAGQIVAGLRRGRPALRHGAAAPLRLEPGVSAFTGKAFLLVHIRDRRVGQWAVGDARQHALAVLEGRATATLDDLYHHLLTAQVELDAGTAHAVVGDLAEHRGQVQ